MAGQQPGQNLLPLCLPPDLQSVSSRSLEEYVRARLIQFAGPFARRLNPKLSPHEVQQAAQEAVSSLPSADNGLIALESRDLQLVFRHDCLSLGCLDPQCNLCEHNPNRRCNVNFAPKYLVNDVLKAKCDAPIRVEIIDRTTGVPLGEDVPDIHLEMCILDGNAYDAKCLEAGQEREKDLDACSIFSNNKGQPLLAPTGAAGHSADSKVIVHLARGMAQLPDIHVSDSSEAMLSGRKPPFRLLVRAVSSDGRKVTIRHAVSEGFVVATRRTRTAGKVEIPNVDDHVSKLEHMGKETVKKLQDIYTAAIQAGVEISVPENCILKVGEFRRLALIAEADGHLRQKLQQVLKLSKEKWDEARDHAMRAVVADNRMRIWYADKGNVGMGLLFTCRLGNVDLDRPVGLLHKKFQDGSQTTLEVTLMAQQTPAQREQGRRLQPDAVGSWWQHGHSGWAIHPVDSEHFISTGSLDPVTLQSEHMYSPNVSPQGETGQAEGLGRYGASRRLPSSSKLSPSRLADPVMDNQPSPFDNQMEGKQELALPNALASMLKPATSPGSAEMPKVMSMSSFPPLPQGSDAYEHLLHDVPSGDLQQLMGHHNYAGQLGESPLRGGFPGSMGDLRMSGLSSMEIPDAAAAVALLHDMNPEARSVPPPMDVLSGNTQLQTMQSIEQALGNVEQQDIMDRVAKDWMTGNRTNQNQLQNPVSQA